MIKNTNKYIYTLIALTTLVNCGYATYADDVLIDSELKNVYIGKVDYKKLLTEYVGFLKKDISDKNKESINDKLTNLIEYAEEMLSKDESDKDFEIIYYKLINEYNNYQITNSSPKEYSTTKNIEYYMRVLDNLSIPQDNKITELENNKEYHLDANTLIDEVTNLLEEKRELKSYKAKLLNSIINANEIILEKSDSYTENTIIYESVEHAENIYNSNEVDIEMLKTTIEAIDGTIRSTYSNYRNELKNEIERAEDIVNSIEVGNKPGQYTQDSVNKLYAAIYTANQKYDNNGLSDDELNTAIQTLKSEITIFQNSVIKKPDVDTSILMGLIQQAKKLINETTVGNEINQVPSGEKEKLQTILDSAIIIAEMSSPTQEVVDDAVEKLNNAVIEFRENIKLKVDKSALSDSIKKAVSLQNTITNDKIGEEVGMYPKEAKKRFDKAIEKAQSIMNNNSVLQEEVDIMVNYLEDEIDIFKNTQITEKIDKSKLKLSIKNGETLLKNVVVGNGDGMTKKEAVDEFKLELDSAKKIASSFTVTQSEVDTATSKLDEAIVKLKEAENTKYVEHMTALKSEIEGCIGLYNESAPGLSVGEYPEESKKEFKKAIEKAESILSSNNKNSNIYIKALSTLENAREKFESSKIENSNIESSMDELNQLLREITTLIKTTAVGSVNDGVNENQKIALSVMLSKINKMVEDTDNVGVISNAIKLAKNTISDFKDESIYIDNNNNVNGRKLTGKVTTISNKTPKTEVIKYKEEFIPQAGIPIDIKAILPTLSLSFMSIGAILNKKSKK